MTSKISLIIDQVRKTFGFRNIHTIIKDIQAIIAPNYSLFTKDQEPVLDLGPVITVNKSKNNQTPVPLSLYFSDIIHLDIVYDIKTAIGDIRYSIICS